MAHRQVLWLSLGHLITDLNQGALPALLPFLIVEYQLSYTAAAFLVFASNIASTVVQPLFGHLADRLSVSWLMPAGILLAGLGFALTGVVPGYSWVLLAVMGSGVGIAAFHPQGAWLVHRLAGERASAMSVFGVGGTLGFALGPALATAAILHWGLRGSLVLGVPAALTAGLLLWRFGAESIRRGSPGPSRPRATRETPDAWAPFGRLTATVVSRAILGYGLNTFIPLYWIYGLQQSQAAGALALTLFSFSGVLGNLLGGHVADRLGHTRVALSGFCALLPLVPALAVVRSAALALVLVAAVGFLLATSYSPLVVLGQQYLPNHIGLSSGVTLGISVTIGGAATPLLGQVADHHGVSAAIAVLALAPFLSAGLALTLPHPDRLAARSPGWGAERSIRS